MTTRYFEYAVSEGEGTLTAHGVLVLYEGGKLVLGLTKTPQYQSLTFLGDITAERYAEFITIHGSEVAV